MMRPEGNSISLSLGHLEFVEIGYEPLLFCILVIYEV